MADVLNIEALDKLEIFSSRTRASRSDAPFFAVFGHPIAHSMSPLMQNAALAAIAKDYSSYVGAKYFAFDVPPEELGLALDKFAQRNFCGINLTIPLKQTAMGIVENFDSSAKTAGACNTLKLLRGKWIAYNTDGYGISKGIETALGVKLRGSNVFLYGAGGAARGIAFKMVEKKCRSMVILNRTISRAEGLSSDIFAATGFKCSIAEQNASVAYPEKSILINATSVGLKSTDAPIIDFSAAPEDAVFFDTPYRRGAETASVIAARAAGLKAENGLAMLAWQGAKSLSIWTGKKLYGTLMLETLKKDFYGIC